jgi:hypothetical protein
MTLQSQELFAGPATVPVKPRMHAERVGVFLCVAGTALLPLGTPMVKRVSTGFWEPYSQPSDAAVFTITANGTPATAGTFDLLIDGLVVELAFDVAAAALQSAVNAALANAGRAYSVAAVATTGVDLGDASAVITITFSENAGAPSVDIDVGDLTGNPHVLATVDAGTALDGSNVIRAFVYESPIQLVSGGEVHGVLLLEGEVVASDVNTAAIRAVLGGSPSEAEIEAALVGGKPSLRELGILVRGLPLTLA